MPRYLDYATIDSCQILFNPPINQPSDLYNVGHSTNKRPGENNHKVADTCNYGIHTDCLFNDNTASI